MRNKKDFRYAMFNNDINREMLILFFAVLLFAVLFPLRSDGDGVHTLSVAVFPFKNAQNQSIDMQVPARISQELSKRENIRIIPLEVVTEKLYEMEPSYMWTEREGWSKEGGMIWKVSPKTIMEFRKGVEVDYTVHGDIWNYGSSWKIDSIITGGDDSSTRSFSVFGEDYSDVPAKMVELTEKMLHWILEDNAVISAEEDVRNYLGGMYSHDFVMKRMQHRVKTFPDVLQVRALMLDLMRKEKGTYQDQIVIEGGKTIDLIDPSNESEIRYLLSLSLDPFDLVAGIYEMRNEWPQAIEIRRRALELFPVRAAMHKKKLGKSYYFYGVSQEEGGTGGDAIKNYRLALEFLDASSELHERAQQGVQRLQE